MADTLKNKVSPHIESQLPDFVREEHPLFSLFLKYYYEFLEAGELSLSGSNNYVVEETLSKNYILEETGENIVLEDSVGKFVAGETIIGLTSGFTATVLVDDFDSNNRLFITSQQKFITGEQVRGQTSGGVATVLSYRPNPVQNIQQLLEFADVDNTVYDFLDTFKESFMESLPNTLAEGLEKRKLLKNIKDLYTAKGTRDGHKLFFRILFNEEPVIAYPRDNIFRPSDGQWSTDKIIRVVENGTSNFSNSIGERLTGGTSGATALIGTVIKFREGATLLAEINLDANSVNGTFISGETVTTTDSQRDLEISAQVKSIVTGAVVTTGGAYYNIADPVYITGGNGNGQATARVDGAGTGSIDEIMIENGGSGYTVNEELVFNTINTEGRGVRAKVAVVGGSVNLETFTSPDHFITEDGDFVITQDRNFIKQEETVGEHDHLVLENGDTIILEEATFTDLGVSSEIGEITKIKMIDKGNGFIKLPTVTTPNNTSGSGATLYSVSNITPMVGNVQGVVITNFGLDYSVEPTFTLNRCILVKNVSGTFAAGDSLISHDGVVVNFDVDTHILQLKTSVTFSRDDLIETITGASATVYQSDFATATSSVGTVGETVGNYISDRGKISEEAMKIQDSYYYQDYSYVVRIGESINRWRDSIRRSVHPAGWNVFGEVSFASQVSATIQVPAAGTVSGFDDTTFSPELASTFTNLFTTVFGRRIGTADDSTKSVNAKVGVPLSSDLNAGERDVTVTSEVDVRLDIDRGNTSFNLGPTLENFVKYAFTVSPVYDSNPSAFAVDPGGRIPTISSNLSRDQYSIAQWGYLNIRDVSLADGSIPSTAFRTKINVMPPSEIIISRGGRYNTFDNDFMKFSDGFNKFDEAEFGIGDFDNTSVTFDSNTTFDKADLKPDTEGLHAESFDENNILLDNTSLTFDIASGNEEDWIQTWDTVNLTSGTFDGDGTRFDAAPDGTVTKPLFSDTDYGVTLDSVNMENWDNSESNTTRVGFGILDQNFDKNNVTFDRDT
jgi:hypothetical protein